MTLPSLFAALLVSAACSGTDPTGHKAAPSGSPEADGPPLADGDAMMQGVPDGDELPSEAKADIILPRRYVDLVAFQSPVRNQGYRAICSVFSSVALIESLAILRYGWDAPDFSEQHLHWSVKEELGSYPELETSNPEVNLLAASRFGVMAEAAWPYNERAWTEEQDPACDGTQGAPPRCHTQGRRRRARRTPPATPRRRGGGFTPGPRRSRR